MYKENYVTRKIPPQNEHLVRKCAHIKTYRHYKNMLYCKIDLHWIQHRPNIYARLFKETAWAK